VVWEGRGRKAAPYPDFGRGRTIVVRRHENGRPAISRDFDAVRNLLVRSCDCPGMATHTPPERRIARALRALLERVEPGGALPDTIQLLVVLSCLESFIPGLLAETYPHWTGESLDGFFLAKRKKLGDGKAELRGMSILISDQAVTPFHLRMRLSGVADEIDWMECRLGRRGDGAGGMNRVPWSQWDGRTHALLQDSFESIAWANAIAFGEEAESGRQDTA
jgi:hypothetical protein